LTPIAADTRAKIGRNTSCDSTLGVEEEPPIRSLAAKAIYAVVIAEVIAGLIAGVLAYFVRSFHQPTGAWFDGLGRRLEEAPFIARFVFGAESQWAGWGYFALDFVVFGGGVALAYGLLTLAGKLEKDTPA